MFTSLLITYTRASRARSCLTLSFTKADLIERKSILAALEICIDSPRGLEYSPPRYDFHVLHFQNVVPTSIADFMRFAVSNVRNRDRINDNFINYEQPRRNAEIEAIPAGKP
jgi:hypothetical protein